MCTQPGTVQKDTFIRVTIRQSPNGMADPFEVRMRFTSLLQHLNASVTSAQKAAAYALKYRDMDEDLHSCILEQLEKVSTPSCGMDGFSTCPGSADGVWSRTR